MEPVQHGTTNRPPASPDWEAFRRQMPVARNWAYFDHAAVAPISEPARLALAQWSDDSATCGAVHWAAWAQSVEQTRRRAAEMIGADSAEIALVHNTTEGISLVAEGYPWRAGDNIVTPADEFPSNQYPWMNLQSRGVECRRVAADGGRVDLDRLAAACDNRTRIISISWVGYASGWRHDVAQLAQLAHQQGALLFLDAIQGLGVFPLDVHQTGVDFLAADGHKWLLGPEGAGVFYLRREHLDLLRPLGVGWNSVERFHDFTHVELKLRPAAVRYEGGSCNMPGLLALGASLDLLAQYGQAAISQRVLQLTDLACGQLQRLGATVHSCPLAEHASGIVSFELPGRDPQQVKQHCARQRVILSCRAGRLRISPHAYNNPSDVDRLVAALADS